MSSSALSKLFSAIINKTTLSYLSNLLVTSWLTDNIKNTIKVVITAASKYPMPTAIPIHVTDKIPAAVVTPFTLKPFLTIVPAPINPIPANIWDGIRAASISYLVAIYVLAITTSAELRPIIE